MNTLSFVNQGDSLYVALYNRVAELEKPETNCADVAIVQSICHTFLYVVIALIAGFILWKIIDHVAAGISGWNRRRWEVADRKMKQEANLQDKRLSFMEKNSSKEDYLTEIANMIQNH